MQKIDLNQITKPDILEFLKTKESYLFEKKIENKCRNFGLSVEHSGSYIDPITQKRRQFDLRILIKRNNLVIRLAIECKFLKNNYPILVCTSPRVDSEAYHFIVKSFSANGRRVNIQDFNNFETYEYEKIRKSYYQPCILVGKSIEQVGKQNEKFLSDNSDISDKWTQALNQSHDLLLIANKDYKLNQGYNTYVLILPILVVPDKTVWRAKVDDIDINEDQVILSNDVDIYFGDNSTVSDHNDNNFIFSHLKILTESGLDYFLNEISENKNDIWNNLFPGKAL